MPFIKFLCVVLPIALIVLLAARAIAEHQTRKRVSTPNVIGIAAACLVFLVGVICAASFGELQAGQRGVVLRYGAPTSPDNRLAEVKGEGLYFVMPFTEAIVPMNVRVNRFDAQDAEAVTSDRQRVHTTVAAFVQVNPTPEKLVETYRNYRNDAGEIVVRPKLQEAVKTVTARYDAAFQVRNRPTVRREMLDFLKSELEPQGFIVQDVVIVNFAYDPDYQRAIEATQVSQQNLIKAENDLRVKQIESQQQVVDARAKAEAQRLLASGVNDRSLAFQFLSKWDGRLPAVTAGGNNGGLMLDIGRLMNEGDRTPAVRHR